MQNSCSIDRTRRLCTTPCGVSHSRVFREMFAQCTLSNRNCSREQRQIKEASGHQQKRGPANICLRGEKTANPANYSHGSRREETARTLFLREPPARISSDLSSSLPVSSDRDTKRSVTLLYITRARPIKILRVARV